MEINSRRKLWTKRAGIGFAVIAVLSSMVTTVPSPTSAVGTSGAVSGRVYLDVDVNGVYVAATDSGQSGVAVTAYDYEGGILGTSTSAADGTWSITLSNAHPGTVRVEFDVPSGMQATIISNVTGSTGSSIQFVEPGATGVDFGVFDPSQYCQADAKVGAVCLYRGSIQTNPGDRVLGLAPFLAPTANGPQGVPIAVDQSQSTIETIASKSSVGAVWGVAWQKNKKLIWTSAMLRRHSALGPKGIGGLYVFKDDGTAVGSFDLIADKGLTLAANPTTAYTEAARDIVTAANNPDNRSPLGLSRDQAAFVGVGKVGIGDIDVSDDGQYLWLTNLYQRKIQRIALGGTASAPTLGTVTSWSIDDGHTCAKPTLRAWGLKPRADGTVLVAAQCTNDQLATLTTAATPGEGVVMKLDPSQSGPAAWTTLTTVDFTGYHKHDYCGTGVLVCSWKSWSDNWSQIEPLAKQGTQYWWPMPMITDIEVGSDGSLVLGVSDRLSYMGGESNYTPVANGATYGWMTTWVAGDMIMMCKTATGWEQESDGSCTNHTHGDNRYQTPSEFFFDDFGHPETVIGGLAFAFGQVASTAMDPAAYYSGGVRWNRISDGNQTNGRTFTTDLGKASSMGDVEVLCDVAPLQIGNYIWLDLNHNGIQDPGEAPVAGVTVSLYDSSNTLVGRAVTNADGEYYFTSSTVEAANGGSAPDAFGGGLAADTAYSIVLDNSADFAVGGPLHGYTLTTNDASTAAGPAGRDNLIDSDATATGPSNAPKVTVVAQATGVVNHGYDIGFWVPGVSVGDLVWLDSDGDGTLDPTDPGMPGVTVTITKADGSAVTDVLGRPVTTRTTDASGRYRFDLLPLGQYKVTLTVPDGHELVANHTVSVQSLTFSSTGTSDLSLDFGLKVSASSSSASPTTAAPPPSTVASGRVKAKVKSTGTLPRSGSDLSVAWTALVLLGAGLILRRTRRT